MIRICPHCHTKNRIPTAHLADAGRCGSCKEALPPLDTPVEADTALFNEAIREARVPVLVDFWAPWCGPCKMAGPEVTQAAARLAGKALVLKVNTESEPGLASQYGVRSIPNFAVFNGGAMRWQQAGLMNHRQLEHAVLTAV